MKNVMGVVGIVKIGLGAGLHAQMKIMDVNYGYFIN